MTKHLSYLVRWAGVALVIAALLVPGAGRMQAEAGARQASTAPDNSEAARLEGSIEVAEPPAVHKDSYPKLESRLAQLYESAVLGTGRPLETFAGQRHIDLEAGSARVILEMDADPEAHQAAAAQIETITGDGGTITVQHAPLIGIRADLESAIAATGATYETAYKTMVQVLAPFRSLPALGDIPGVRLVRYPFPSQTQDLEVPSGTQPAPKVGTYTSQGVALTNAGNWIAAGYDGTGVNLAIFDFGFTAYDTRQGTGDLPAGGGLVTHDFGTGGYDFTTDPVGYGHGTSCSEIAFDMAPGATVHLYAFETEIELGNAVADYINNVSGKKVATMSIGWVNAGPYDGTGVVNTIIDTAQAAGIFFATSAGNHQKSHWSGTSVQYSTGDSIAFGAGDLNFIGPAPGVVWSVTAGTELDIFLEWNDWNSGRTGNQNHVDYDLQLHKYDLGAWTVVATSTANQCTTTVEPTEGIAFTTTATDYYGITIWRDTGGGACTNNFGHWMSLFSFNGFNLAGEGAAHVFAYHNSGNSIGIPGDGDSAVTVGASFWNEDWSAPLYGLETFSSLGPRNASGGANPGAAINKPNVVAPDGVSTVTDGTNNGTNYANAGGGFWGTSAASPHVAGLAATAWQGYPGYTLAQLRSYILDQAQYKAGGGACGVMPDEAGVASESTTRNCRFGWGRVNLGSDPLAAPGGKAPQCLDNTSGTEAQPEGDLPSAGSGQPLASPAAGSPPPAIDLPAVAVDAVDAGTAAAPEEPQKEAQSEPGPHGEEGAPEVVARVPNLEVDGGYVLPNASAHIDTAADSSGNLYVAYEYLDGTDYDIVVGKSVDNGRTWSLYLLGGTTSERHPAMVIDSSNYVYIAVDYTLSGVTYPGYYKTATAGDVSSFGSLSYFNTYPAGAANPAIAISGGGTTATVYAVWQYIASGSRYTLRYWYSTNGGSSWTTSATTACGTSYSCLYPSIAISISGSTYVTVAWQYDVTGQGDVYVQQETAGNDAWTTRLSYTATDKQGFPTLASSGANVYFAYVDAYSTANDDVYYRYSTNGGTSFNTSDISVAATGSNERYPSLSASGSAVRVAYSYNSGTSIYLKQSATAYGATWGSAYTMTDLSRPVLEGFRCLDVSFRTALHPEVAWIDVRNSSSNPDPYYSTLDDPPAAASPTWPADAAALYAYAPPLTWSAASDPDGDTVRYWWYIDTANPPANKVGGPVTQLSSLPYYTVPGRTYYWKVVSDDGYRLTSSSVRSFTTAYETDSGTYTEAFTTDPGVTTGTKWSRRSFACLDCFEAGPIRWTVSPSGKWARSTTYAWTGTYSAQALYDANSATYDITTPAALDLRGSTWAYLNTHWRGSSESGYDTLYVQTSPDNSTWTTRNARTGDNNAGWWTYTDGNIDLSAFAGAASGYARIRFTTDSSNYGSGYGVGWFVDDFEVSRASEWSWMNADPYYYRLQTTGAFVGYTNNLVDQFYSPFIRLPSSGPINLYLRERFTISSGDTGSIWILDTTTGIWERLDSFSGTETNWIDYLLRIPDTYLGKTVVVALILRSDGTGTLGSPEETGGYWDVDTFRLELGPTSVVLKSFKAWPEAPAIHVRWETAQEIDNLGFNLYRSNTRNGPKLKLNQELIPTKVPPGSPFGAVYDYIDGFRLRSGRAYFYWLEDVDLHGNATVHGPVRVLCP